MVRAPGESSPLGQSSNSIQPPDNLAGWPDTASEEITPRSWLPQPDRWEPGESLPRQLPPHALYTSVQRIRSDELQSLRKAKTKTLAAVPDEQIDTSDIPEAADWTGAMCGSSRGPQCATAA
jgi:hypothetical protein